MPAYDAQFRPLVDARTHEPFAVLGAPRGELPKLPPASFGDIHPHNVLRPPGEQGLAGPHAMKHLLGFALMPRPAAGGILRS